MQWTTTTWLSCFSSTLYSSMASGYVLEARSHHHWLSLVLQSMTQCCHSPFVTSHQSALRNYISTIYIYIYRERERERERERLHDEWMFYIHFHEMFGVVHTTECVSTRCVRAKHEWKNPYTTVMNPVIYLSNQLKLKLYIARFILYAVQKASNKYSFIYRINTSATCWL